jgi:hypothetical protein
VKEGRADQIIEDSSDATDQVGRRRIRLISRAAPESLILAVFWRLACNQLYRTVFNCNQTYPVASNQMLTGGCNPLEFQEISLRA